MLVSGWASTVDVDWMGHRVAADAFAKSIQRRGITGPKGVKLLYGHDRNMPLGPIHKLEVRNRGLWIEAEIVEGISYGKDVATVVRAVGGLSFSIGFYPMDVDINEKDGVLDIDEGDLFEVSVVTVPANEEAVMERVQNKTGTTPEIELRYQMQNLTQILRTL